MAARPRQLRPHPVAPPGQPAVSTVARRDRHAPQIDHIIVLIMENHSYDSTSAPLALGRRLPVRYATDTPVDANPVGDANLSTPSTCRRPASSRGPPARTGTPATRSLGRRPQRRLRSTRRPGRDGLLGRADLPFYYGMSRTFPVSRPLVLLRARQTYPNRRFLIGGTAAGLVEHLGRSAHRAAPAERHHLRPAPVARHLVGELLHQHAGGRDRHEALTVDPSNF